MLFRFAALVCLIVLFAVLGMQLDKLERALSVHDAALRVIEDIIHR